MITSSSNNRIKALVQLNQKSKVRREQDVFITEGIKMFLEAPLDRIREVYVSESFYLKQINSQMDSAFEKQAGEAGDASGQKLALKEKIQKIPYEIVSDDVFNKISDTQTPQGILCVISQFHYTLEDLFINPNPLLVLLEDLQDPGNLGTIVRTGEGAGISGVILTKDCVDIYNPKTIRATMGSIFRIPFVFSENFIETIEILHKKNIETYAAHLKGTKFYDQPDYVKGTAFLIGNEGNGLKEETALAAKCYIKIPMAGKVESLNAGIATSLFMYEASRQRRNDGK